MAALAVQGEGAGDGEVAAMKYALIFGVVLGAILLFLLAAASGNTALFSRHYALLLGLNAALAAALLALIGYQLWLLTAKLRKRVFGSRLTLRFLLMFLPMVIVPGGLVYVVSLQFMAKSIESWFDVRVDNALEGGLNLGRTALELLLTELNDKARRMALDLSDKPAGQQVVLLDRLREQAGVDDAVILSSGGSVIASASKGVGKLVPDLPSSMIQRQARQSRGYSALEALPDKGLSLRVLVPVAALSIAADAAVDAVFRHRARFPALGAPVRTAGAAGRRHPGGGARRLQPPRASHQFRRARHPDAIVQQHDRTAGRRAQRGRIAPLRARNGQGVSGKHPRKSVRGRVGAG